MHFMKGFRNIVMQAIRVQAATTFSLPNYNGREFESHFSKLHRMMNKLSSDDVCLDYSLLERPVSKSPAAPVTYVEIFEDPNFTITMFIMRDGSKIPLHDHPLMYGVLKVIHGRVKIRSYSLLEDCVDQVLSAKVLSAVSEKEILVSEQDDASVLRPLIRNIHEISTIDGPAAFVDVLAPPYLTSVGDDRRDCHYYREVGTDDKGLVLLRKAGRDRSFWTDLAPYNGQPL